MRVIYIGGIGRSGSTLLERMLGGLPGVCALGEVANLWHRRLRGDERCGCGTLLPECQFWEAVGDRAFGGWHRCDLPQVLADQQAVERIRNIPWLARSRLPRHWREVVTAHAARYVRIYRAAADAAGVDVIVDSSKCPGLAFCLRWAYDLDLRVVHLVRDPRGVAYSFTKQVSRPEAIGAALMPRCSPARSAFNWCTHNLAMGVLARAERHRRANGREVAVHRVRYEELVADPHGTVRSLAAIAGLAPAEVDLRYLGDARADLRITHSVAGNPMRFQVGEVPLRPDEAWRTGLPVRHRRVVSAICAPLLTAYGYPAIGSPPAGRLR